MSQLLGIGFISVVSKGIRKLTINLALLWMLEMVFAVALLGQFNPARFQSFILEKVNTNTPTDAITGITQDTLGQLWFSTNNGIVRYDGLSFERYATNMPDDRIVWNVAYNVQTDSLNNLWLGLGGGRGLLRYNASSGETMAFSHDPKNPTSISSGFIERVHIDGEGRIWALGFGNSAVNRVMVNKDGAGDNTIYFDRYDQYTGLSHGDTWAASDDQYGHLWVGTGNGLNRLHITTGQILQYFHSPDDEASIPSNNVQSVLIDSEGWLWVGTDNGLSYCTNPQASILKFYHLPIDKKPGRQLANTVINKNALPSPLIRCLAEMDGGLIAVGMYDGGVSIYDKKSKEFDHSIIRQVVNKYGIRDWDILSLFQDMSGTLWVGSAIPHGLFKVNQSKFGKVTADQSELQLANNNVYTVAEANQRIWISHDEGIESFHLVNGDHQRYLGDPFEFIEKKILFVDSRGVLWVGSHDGLFSYQPELDKFQPLELPIFDTDPTARFISNIIEDSKGKLWVASFPCGITKIDHSNGTKHYNFEIDECAGARWENRVMATHLDSKGLLWVGTLGGVYLFNENKDEFVRVNDFPTKVILDGPDGSLILNTEDNILKMQLSGDFHVTEFVPHRLAANLFPFDAMIFDDSGNLWLPTAAMGLWMFDPITNRIQGFSEKQGIQGMTFNYHSTYKKRGILFFGGTNGLNLIDPTEITNSSEIPKVEILEVSLTSSKEGWSYDDLYSAVQSEKTISIPYHVDMLEISFGVMDFVAPELNRYEYKLSGLQKEWQELGGAQNKAVYTSLDPGTYQFKVKGANSYGYWNEDGVFLTVKVLPPPWKSWYAYLAYMLLMIVMFYSLRNYELRRIRMRHQLEQEKDESRRLAELDQMKSNFFANISHEFRTPLSLITGHAQRLKNDGLTLKQVNAVEVLEHNANKVLQLVNQLLELSKVEHGTIQLNIKKYLVKDLVHYACSQFTSLAEMKKIDFTVHSEVDLEILCDAEKIIVVLNNLLTNAFKFTDVNGQVTVKLALSKASGSVVNPSVEISIADTGIGIPDELQEKIFDRFYQVNNSSTRNFEGTGIGLALCKELVSLHHGDIKVKSEDGAGSTFIISLPLAHPDLDITDAEIEHDLPTSYSSHLLTTGTAHEIDAISLPAAQESLTQILVVEDNLDLRRFLVEGLSDHFKVIQASDGKSGLDTAIEEVPELIISDLMMPVMDGMELCQALKSDTRTSHIPIILLTAKSDRDTKLDSFKFGADDYLLKPFDFEEILARINNLILQRQKLQEKYRSRVFLAPDTPDKPSIEERFLIQLSETIKNQYQDPSLSVKLLAKTIGISEVQLFRKTKALTGVSANELVRNYRLKVAESLILKNTGNISEIAYEVGFTSPSYFTKCFKQKYGQTPREYQNNSQLGIQ